MLCCQMLFLSFIFYFVSENRKSRIRFYNELLKQKIAADKVPNIMQCDPAASETIQFFAKI